METAVLRLPTRALLICKFCCSSFHHLTARFSRRYVVIGQHLEAVSKGIIKVDSDAPFLSRRVSPKVLEEDGVYIYWVTCFVLQEDVVVDSSGS